ncbi:MAG: putative cytosol aminopeptidase, partial [Acidobacteria bacterium]|nr:putative cytosol aminopeptidase [Acidobacteriota bacterium]
MLTVHQTPAIALTIRPSRDIETDLLIVPVFEDDTLEDEADLDGASGGEVAAARARGDLKGKAFDLFFTSVRGWKASRLALVGVGSRKDFSPDRLRRAAITGGLAARQRRMTSIAIVHRPGTDVD